MLPWHVPWLSCRSSVVADSEETPIIDRLHTSQLASQLVEFVGSFMGSAIYSVLSAEFGL
jgi:hypothetical protein